MPNRARRLAENKNIVCRKEDVWLHQIASVFAPNAAPNLKRLFAPNAAPNDFQIVQHIDEQYPVQVLPQDFLAICITEFYFFVDTDNFQVTV